MVRSESYVWLNAAARKVLEAFIFSCVDASYKAATRPVLRRKWFPGFDPRALTASATEYIGKISANTTQSMSIQYAQRCKAAMRLKLRWCAGRGSAAPEQMTA
jgi:hypothetical protein